MAQARPAHRAPVVLLGRPAEVPRAQLVELALRVPLELLAAAPPVVALQPLAAAPRPLGRRRDPWGLPWSQGPRR